MAHGVGGATESKPNVKVIKAGKKLVIEDIEIQELKYTINVPDIKYVPEIVHYEKPVVTEKETVKYNVIEKPTVKYNVDEKETIKYNAREVPCEKPVIDEVVYERPVIKDKVYERPVIKEKVYEILAVKNIDELKAYVEMVKRLNEELPKLKEHLDTLKEYRLVEQVIKVPKNEYTTVKVERIEWVPVKREMDGLIKE